MRTTLLTGLLLLSVGLISCGAKPTPTPVAAAAPNPAASPQGLQSTPQIYTAQLVAQGIQQINGILAWDKALNEGVPASNGNPAISSDDLKNALGKENVEKIRTIAKVLRGGK